MWHSIITTRISVYNTDAWHACRASSSSTIGRGCAPYHSARKRRYIPSCSLAHVWSQRLKTETMTLILSAKLQAMITSGWTGSAGMITIDSMTAPIMSQLLRSSSCLSSFLGLVSDSLSSWYLATMTSFLNKSEEPVYTLADGQPVHDPSTSLQIRSRLVTFLVPNSTSTANILSQLWRWWTCLAARHSADRVGA